MQKPNQKQFTRHAASVAKARAFVVEVLGDRPLHGRLDDVRVCVSELAASAVRHGVPVGRQFLVRVADDGERVRVEVHDGGEGVPVVRPARALDDAGRGMVLVDGLSDAWGVEARRGPGKAVWAEFRIGRQ
ncbi:ATP-binding protein [Streptomyces synnematoformans]|uniref:ATP-binding protein n=1 Tax=Streptomyces synnematoformans TaxID=415721 RepID=A0ABN2YCQ6_9ACTN